MSLPIIYAPAYDCGMEDKYSVRLKKAMGAAGVTQYKLAQMSGVPQPTISRILKSISRNPTTDKLEALANALDISIAWLISGEGPMTAVDARKQQKRQGQAEAHWDREKRFDEMVLALKADGLDPATHLGLSDEEFASVESGEVAIPDWLLTTNKPKAIHSKPDKHELEFVGRMDVWDSNTPLDDDEVELPLFREVELAAGAGQTEVIENQGAKLRFAKSTLSRAGVQKENAACAFVKGNSMEPVMPDGTCVGVDTGDTTVRDGEIYAIDHDGMLRVKYLRRRPGGGIKIVSQNSIEHEAEDYTAARVVEENIRIIGRVFWWSVLR